MLVTIFLVLCLVSPCVCVFTCYKTLKFLSVVSDFISLQSTSTTTNTETDTIKLEDL